MIEIIGIVIAGFVPIAGWILAIQSKVSAHEVQIDSQKELILSKLEDIDARLDRIERCLNGHLHEYQ